jgi:hypothetical protein
MSHVQSIFYRLTLAESKLSSLEPRAVKANELEKEIANLKDEIRHIRTANYILTDENILQAEIIRSRAASPCYFRSRTPSPCALIRSRCASPICISRYIFLTYIISSIEIINKNSILLFQFI